MIDIGEKFKVHTGYSDHAMENYTAIHAASLGACMIETCKLKNLNQ